MQSQSQSSVESINDPVKSIIVLLENGIWGKHQMPFRIFLLFSILSSFFVVFMSEYCIKLDQALWLQQSSILNYEISSYLIDLLSIERDLRLYETNLTDYTDALNKIAFNDDYLAVTIAKVENISEYLLLSIN